MIIELLEWLIDGFRVIIVFSSFSLIGLTISLISYSNFKYSYLFLLFSLLLILVINFLVSYVSIKKLREIKIRHLKKT